MTIIKQLKCDNCKESLGIPDSEEEQDQQFMRGDDIYCCGKSRPHDHYRSYRIARKYVADNEIEETIVIEVEL